MSASTQTVEEYLKSRTLSIASSITNHAAQLEAKLRAEFEAGSKELLATHRLCLEGASSEPSDMDVDEADHDKENSSSASSAAAHTAPSAKASSSASAAKAPPRSTRKKAAAPAVTIIIESGPHASSTFSIRPGTTKATHAYVGRSTGKKFRSTGLSLPKDLEVSTTHGHFLSDKAGRVYFVDTGSTNGTFYNEVQLEEGEPLEVKDGTKIRCGASIFRIGITAQ
mmetsp:Transcript_25116/g.50051  ORF Transcript_25116/g.50051 Transcript_25116/m.50051 type:complete len:225 (+) Transcript_25116:126-800(+)